MPRVVSSRARVASCHQCSRRRGDAQVYRRGIGPHRWTGWKSRHVCGRCCRRRERGRSPSIGTPRAGVHEPQSVNGETGEERLRGIG
eukprot:34450-Pleurochrysis_carterae.AAC.2